MNSKWERLIDRYLDGEVSDAERRTVERRLAAEPAFRERLDSRARWFRGLAAGAPLPRSAPPELRIRIMEKIRQSETASHPGKTRSGGGSGISSAWMVGGMALGLAVVGVWLDLKSKPAFAPRPESAPRFLELEDRGMKTVNPDSSVVKRGGKAVSGSFDSEIKNGRSESGAALVWGAGPRTGIRVRQSGMAQAGREENVSESVSGTRAGGLESSQGWNEARVRRAANKLGFPEFPSPASLLALAEAKNLDPALLLGGLWMRPDLGAAVVAARERAVLDRTLGQTRRSRLEQVVRALGASDFWVLRLETWLREQDAD